MIEQLSQHPILLLFIVAASGYLIGSIKIGTNKLGVAAVLFVGLFVGAIDSRLDIPEIVFLLGLSMYVYSIGLSSGPAFFKSYKKNGLRDIGFIIAMLFFSGIVAVGLFFLFGFSAGTITGMYAGSTTNTPAMAGVIDYVNSAGLANGTKITEQIVIGYSFSYPMGILGGMIAIALSEKFLKIDYAEEKERLKSKYPIGENLTSRTIVVLNKDIINTHLRDLQKEHRWNVVFGRIRQEGRSMGIAKWDSVFAIGDRILVAGNISEIESVVQVLGEEAKNDLKRDHSDYDVRRIFVSNPKVVGRTISSLNLDRNFDCVISRIRRGDMEMLAKEDTILELGDRIRFVARRKDLKGLANLFGDSYTESAKVNLFSFGLGIGLGLLLGNISINLGAISFK